VPLTHHKFIVYGDGSCLRNPDGPGGWGVIVIAPDGSRCEFNGHSPSTTNNRMELTAAIEGLRATEPGSHVVFRSDSQYVVNTIEHGWKRNKNHDLWRLLDAERDARTVEFEWVRGHGTDPLNNRADELAVMGAQGRSVSEETTDGEIVARPVRKKPRALDAAGLRRLKSILKSGEEIRECASCGAKFVSPHAHEDYCSQAPCQLKARTA